MKEFILGDKLYCGRAIQWSHGKGRCQKPAYKSTCGYYGAKKECVSHMVEHACKHLINSDGEERKCTFDLCKGCDSSLTDVNMKIDCRYDEASTLENSPCVQAYRNISLNADDYIDYGFLSKKSNNTNFVFHCHGDYEGFKAVIDPMLRMHSFFFDKRIDPGPYFLHSALYESLNGVDGELWFPNRLAKEVASCIPVYSDCIMKSIGVGSVEKAEHAFENRSNIVKDGWFSYYSTIFNMYYNPSNVSKIESLYEKIKDGDTKKTENLILNGYFQTIKELLITNFSFGMIDTEEALSSEEIANAKVFGFVSEYDNSLEEWHISGELFSRADYKMMVQIIREIAYKDVKELLNNYAETTSVNIDMQGYFIDALDTTAFAICDSIFFLFPYVGVNDIRNDQTFMGLIREYGLENDELINKWMGYFNLILRGEAIIESWP